MPLEPGTRLGGLEIIALLGRGGMGEVYRARDPELGRDVAVKILPESFTADPERVARFRREAQMLAALNHPHIAAIYGMHEAAGVRFLVLELVDGESLDARLARGALPLDEAIAIARQIAQALEAAHEKGIVHRDLKPANIALTADGRVKVLDFGLAKALEASATASDSVMNSPTITSPALMTGLGVILGTAAYMSPEQAKGRVADRRSDVWAFGCVLYEMLTGKRPFEGEDVSDTLALILTREPDWSALPPTAPPSLVGLLKRCLAKDRSLRLRDMGDIVLALDDARAADGAAVAAAPAPRVRLWWIWPVVTAVAIAVAAGFAWRSYRGAPPERVVRLEMVLPESMRVVGAVPEISPDGRTIAFIGFADGIRAIWVRPLDEGTTRRLPGTEGCDGRIFWSPDSRFIGFVDTQRNLKKISPAGGPPQVIATHDDSRDRDWGPDGIILLGGSGPLRRVPAGGGTETIERPLDAAAKETTLDYPHFLPDGSHYLFLARRLGEDGTVVRALYLGRLGSTERQLLPGITTETLYSPTGHMVFAGNGALTVQPFDLTRMQLTGEPTGISELLFGSAVVLAPFSLSSEGDLVVRRLAGGLLTVWVDDTGKQLETVTLGAGLSEGNSRRSLELSPDGRRLAVSKNGDIWIHELATGVTSKLTTPGSVASTPVWSADGRTVIYASARHGHPDLYERDVRAASDERAVLVDAMYKVPTDGSRDYLLYTAREGITRGAATIWALPLSGDRTPLRIAALSGDPDTIPAARLSPDGHWVAYVSSESGTDEVYVQSFPQPGFKQQVSNAGGHTPRWIDGGTQLLFVSDDVKLLAVAVKPTAGGSLEVSAPRTLFQTQLIGMRGSGNAYEYAPGPNGRFLMTVTPASATSPLTVIMNWASTLRK